MWVIEPNGAATEVAPDGKKASLEQLYKLIGTDIVEPVRFRNRPKTVRAMGTEIPITNRTIMIVDEEGLLKAGWKPNPVGCLLYGTAEHGQPIAGTIVLAENHKEVTF